MKQFAFAGTLGFRNSEREILARAVGMSFAVFGAYYLVWRAGWTLNLHALWLSVPLLAAEMTAYLDFLLFLFVTWRVPEPRALLPPSGLKVDVYITTYNESTELLRNTILGALHMRYPHKTYVLDDGARSAVAGLARSLGAQYVSRADRTHAKAGNINHALLRTKGDFIAVFDADHVPHPQFLERTLGYFVDPKLALVQTPQDFYNLDSIQHRGSRGSAAAARWHEQALFYRVIQPGKDRLNSVFWCGTGAVLRRSALASIGGVATETVTEDILTSIKLHAAGWRTVYHNEVLATGIAPDDLDAFITQRRRWAQGAMQILRSRYNPLWARGLSIPQRLSYWASMSTYFASFQRLVLVCTPIVVLMTGILPMRTFGWDFVAHFAPYFVLGQAANSLCGRGYSRYFDTERFNLLKAFTFVRASLTLVIPRQPQFRVTPKAAITNRTRELVGALPYVLLLLTTLGAVAWAARAIVASDMSPTKQFALELTAIWAFYNAGAVALAVRSVLGRTHRRRQYRFMTHLPLSMRRLDAETSQPFDAFTTDLNPEGLACIAHEALAPGLQLHIAISLPDRRPIEATAVVMNDRPIVLLAGESAHRIGVRFVEMRDADRDALTMYLFSEVAMFVASDSSTISVAA